jgi:hypothetical protein
VSILGATLFALYVGLSFWLGYLAGTAVFVIVAARAVGLTWKIAAALAIGASALLYLVFAVGLNVWFPAARITTLLP